MHSSSPLDNELQQHEILPETFIWKERMYWGPAGASVLEPGDALWTAHQQESDGSLKLAKVWANIANEYGYINELTANGCTLRRFDNHHQPTGEILTITYSSVLAEDPLNMVLNGEPATLTQIKNDMFLQVIGLQTAPLAVRATRLFCWAR